MVESLLADPPNRPFSPETATEKNPINPTTIRNMNP